ncbi:Hypothetical predicted protein [Octopus vulgaris]|uniref:Uncharacterized protein n=1 Tax=Octopus vulgaris TaxID=6645 RepID=A0AA36BWJ2_OCTVU|nr:Hypothetical predicted protein [Octopus vulgaris]
MYQSYTGGWVTQTHNRLHSTSLWPWVNVKISHCINNNKNNDNNNKNKNNVGDDNSPAWSLCLSRGMSMVPVIYWIHCVDVLWFKEVVLPTCKKRSPDHRTRSWLYLILFVLFFLLFFF